jgi:Centriolar protein SAS N-terminal
MNLIPDRTSPIWTADSFPITINQNDETHSRLVTIRVLRDNDLNENVSESLDFALNKSKIVTNTMNHVSGGGYNLLHVEIVDEMTSPILLHTLSLTQPLFETLKKEQCILVGFNEFSFQLIELMQMCFNEQENPSSS